mmetsp:Transcript_22629/g.33235  ORF Transcript_22629/g.33235 Transcript_22629/m.33235 type:complete len:437 (+) Transcript_22629:78-1388(+)
MVMISSLFLRAACLIHFVTAFVPVITSLKRGTRITITQEKGIPASTTTSLTLFQGEEPEIGRRKAITSLLTFTTAATTIVNPFGSKATARSSSGLDILVDDTGSEGIAAITQSEIGKSVRRTAVRSAQIADRIDLSWERFSDGLRDKNKCDPITNRRLFDNGTRRDGTKIGNPVLGAMCDPIPLKPLDVEGVAALVLNLSEKAAAGSGIADEAMLRKREASVRDLVSASFSRAAAGEGEQSEQRRIYNMNVYTKLRAYGELITEKMSEGVGNKKALNEAAQKFDVAWGQNILESLAKGANRKNFVPAFPLPSPEDMADRPYNEGSLYDALGSLSVALGKMQEGGLIGHWEISVPEDDYGGVVTVAVDDDISIGAQILLREQGRALVGSTVIAMIKSAMDGAKISYGIDSFFIDPTTTRQELYNPTQLLVSLSNLGE